MQELIRKVRFHWYQGNRLKLFSLGAVFFLLIILPVAILGVTDLGSPHTTSQHAATLCGSNTCTDLEYCGTVKGTTVPTCIPKVSDGQSCTAAYQCLTGVCNSSGTCGSSITTNFQSCLASDKTNPDAVNYCSLFSATQTNCASVSDPNTGLNCACPSQNTSLTYASGSCYPPATSGGTCTDQTTINACGSIAGCGWFLCNNSCHPTGTSVDSVCCPNGGTWNSTTNSCQTSAPQCAIGSPINSTCQCGPSGSLINNNYCLICNGSYTPNTTSSCPSTGGTCSAACGTGQKCGNSACTGTSCDSIKDCVTDCSQSINDGKTCGTGMTCQNGTCQTTTGGGTSGSGTMSCVLNNGGSSATVSWDFPDCDSKYSCVYNFKYGSSTFGTVSINTTNTSYTVPETVYPATPLDVYATWTGSNGAEETILQTGAICTGSGGGPTPGSFNVDLASATACAPASGTSAGGIVQFSWSGMTVSKINLLNSGGATVGTQNPAGSSPQYAPSGFVTLVGQPMIMYPGTYSYNYFATTTQGSGTFTVPQCAGPAPTNTPTPTQGPVCGNGICEAGENAQTCPKDCQGATPTPTEQNQQLATFHLTANQPYIGLIPNKQPNTEYKINDDPQTKILDVNLYFYDAADSNPPSQDLDGSQAIVATASSAIQYDSQTGYFSSDANGQNGFQVDLAKATNGTLQPGHTYNILMKINKYLRINLGAHLLTLDTPITLSTPTKPVRMVVGDINGNNMIDVLDYNIMLACQPNPPAGIDPSICDQNQADLNDKPIATSGQLPTGAVTPSVTIPTGTEVPPATPTIPNLFGTGAPTGNPQLSPTLAQQSKTAATSPGTIGDPVLLQFWHDQLTILQDMILHYQNGQ